MAARARSSAQSRLAAALLASRVGGAFFAAIYAGIMRGLGLERARPSPARVARLGLANGAQLFLPRRNRNAWVSIALNRASTSQSWRYIIKVVRLVYRISSVLVWFTPVRLGSTLSCAELVVREFLSWRPLPSDTFAQTVPYRYISDCF